MDKLKIKNQSHAARCEVCHQSDLFNAETGICQRCYNVYPAPPVQVNQKFGYPLHRQEVWREDNTLVMHKQALLPHRCVKCNRPSNGIRIVKRLSWFSPFCYLLLLANVLFFIIAISIAKKTADVEIGLCEEHFAKRKKDILIGWGLVFGGIAGTFLLALLTKFFFVGLLPIIIGIIVLVQTIKIVDVKKIDDHYVWLKNINREYLNELPGIRQ